MRTKFYRLYNKLSASLPFLLGFFIIFEIESCYYHYDISLTPDQLYFSADGNNIQIVEIQTDGEWFISKVEPYVSVEPKSGLGTTLIVSVEPNDAGNARMSTIVVTSFDDPSCSNTISVYQDGK
ncbi:MAG: BACON domain-containing protein [Prevotella sp.]|nr:BACON domain-containing protein [Prevotella sp.]